MDAKRLKFKYKYYPHCQKECIIKTYKDCERLYFNSKTNTWLPQALDSVTYEDEVDSVSSISSECSDPEDPLSFEPCSIEYTYNEEQNSEAMARATAETSMDHRAHVVDQSRACEIGMLKWFSSMTISLSVLNP